MNEERKAMNEALQNLVVPVLRRMGFSGSLPHFRRRLPDRIDLLTFQFDRYGGGFVVELARCDPTGATTSWGKHIPPNKVTAHDISRPRPRLTPTGCGGDYWYRYDENRSPDDALKELLTALASHAEAWWTAS